MRQRQFNGIIGAPGHGKSTLTAKIVSVTPGNALIYKTHYNIDDNAFAQFPTVAIKKYRGGKVRISDMDIPYPDFLKWVYKNYRNGALVIDDATIYEVNYISRELNKIIAMRRHLGLDVYMIYHGLTGFPIDQFKFLNNLVLFHIPDHFKYKRGKIPKCLELEEAQKRIADQVSNGNKYYYEVVNFS